jgi:molybdate transport system ATP-binding protein
VAIGRALLRVPSVVLMDEPLASLDQARKREILPFLDRLHAELSIPILYVSHDLDEITRLCDHLVTLESGRVLASGELSDVLNEPSSVVLTDGQRSCVLNGRIESYDDDYNLCKVNIDGMVLTVVAGKREIGAAVRLRVLARDVSLARVAPEQTTILNVIPVRVESVPVSTEAYVQVALSCGTNQLMAQVTRRSCDELGLRVGEHVFAQIKAVAVKTVAEGSW